MQKVKTTPGPIKSVTYMGTSFNKDWATRVGSDAFVAAFLGNQNVLGQVPLATRGNILLDAYKAITGLDPTPAAAPPPKTVAPPPGPGPSGDLKTQP